MTESTRAAIYTRISRDHAGDEHGVANQLADCERHAVARGWTVAARYSDNDISASNGKHRPGYQGLMAAAESCEFSVIIVWQTSRLWRNRLERAGGIEVLRKAAVSVAAVKGPSLDMSTAYGRGMAGMLGEFDTMEAEVKGERQKLAAAQRAEQGKPPRGVRLMGYAPDGTVAEHEAAVVREMFTRFHAGASLREVTAWLNDTGVPTRRGGKWSPSSVRDMLINPRYAGRAVYQGKANGHAGTWTPLVSEAVFDLVNIRLSDPRRRNQVGTDRRYLGSGLFLSAVCDRRVVSHTGGGVVRYRCPDAHVLRSIVPVDALVLAVVRGRLARPDLADLLARPDDARGRKVAGEITRLRARLKRIEADYDSGLIDGRRYKIAIDKVTAQLDAARNAQARQAAGSGVAGTLTAPDPVTAFDAAPLGIKRAVIAFLITVKLHPAPRGRHFDGETVGITSAR